MMVPQPRVRVRGGGSFVPAPIHVTDWDAVHHTLVGIISRNTWGGNPRIFNRSRLADYAGRYGILVGEVMEGLVHLKKAGHVNIEAMSANDEDVFLTLTQVGKDAYGIAI